jgi:hypothetical protein
MCPVRCVTYVSGRSIISKYASIPFSGSPSKDRFVNRLSTSRLAGWHYAQGVKTLRVTPERLASTRLSVTSKNVEGSARHCKTVQGAGSHF